MNFREIDFELGSNTGLALHFYFPLVRFNNVFADAQAQATATAVFLRAAFIHPVKPVEYESRHERYDKELVEKHQVDIAGMDTEEKIRLLRKFREALYEELKDAVYKRRGWTSNGIPTLETVRRLGIDFPDVLELLKAHGVE